MLDEHSLPQETERFLKKHWSAFLLGSIAPDAHHAAPEGVSRFTTHFFHYGAEIDPLAEVVMLRQNPMLDYKELGPSDHAAFVAGYLGHLAMDEVWAVEVVYRFFTGRWGDRVRRHFAFTSVIALMDQRDNARLPKDYYQILGAAEPANWLKFLPDDALVKWRDRITSQIKPGGVSETLPILARTIYSGYDDLVDMLNRPERLQSELWDHFPQADIEEKETAAYAHMRHVIIEYLQH